MKILCNVAMLAMMILYGSDTLSQEVALKNVAEDVDIENGIFIAPDGDDENNGGYDSPYASLTKATENAQPGDMIYMMGGTYSFSESQMIDAQGENAKRIVIQPYDDNDVILDMSTIAADQSSDSAAMQVTGENIEIRDLNIMNANGTAVGLDGKNIVFEENFVSGSLGTGVKIGMMDGELAENIRLNSNQVTNSGQSGDDAEMSGAVMATNVDGFIMNNNHIHANNSEGVALIGVQGAEISSNKLDDNMVANIMLTDSSDITIEHNEIFSSEEGVAIDGIAMVAGDEPIQDILVENNYIYNAADGLSYSNTLADGALSAVEFRNNTFFDVKDSAFSLDAPATGANDITFDRNIFSTDGTDFVGTLSNVQGAEFTTNCWNDIVPLPNVANGNDNVSLEVMLANETVSPAMPNNVVSTDGLCREMEAGVLVFEPTELVDSEITLERTNEVVGEANADGEINDEQVVEIAGEELVEGAGDIVSDIVSSEASDVLAETGLPNAPPEIQSFIQSLIRDILSDLSDIFGIEFPEVDVADAAGSALLEQSAGSDSLFGGSGGSSSSSDSSFQSASSPSSQGGSGSAAPTSSPSFSGGSSAENNSGTQSADTSVSPVSSSGSNATAAPAVNNAAEVVNSGSCSFDWAALEASARSNPLEDCAVNDWRGQPTIEALKVKSPSWGSGSYSGKHCRALSSDGKSLKVNLQLNDGGFDTAIQSFSETLGTTNTRVDDVPASLRVTSTTRVTERGDGFKWWVAGPKIGVWPCQEENQCPDRFWPDWNENYVVESSSTTPAEEHARLTKDGGVYLGETVQDGAVYKHYRYPYSDWTQYWAIRQTYRSTGTVAIKPILEFWRRAGMPNNYVQKVKANFESGYGCGTVDITNVTIQ